MATGQQRSALRDRVVDELRTRILAGEFEPGARLKEESIAELIGVSRLPVREAFRRLESEGLLRSQPRRGVVVSVPDESESEVIHDVRVALEVLAVELTAARRDPDIVAALKDSLTTGEHALGVQDCAALDVLNDRFHDLLGEGSGSAYLRDLLRSVRNQWHYLRGYGQRASVSSWHEHAAIVRALVDGEAERASGLMAEHLQQRDAAQRIDR